MKRILILVLAPLLLFFGVGPASATTNRPCTVHNASAPSTQYIVNGVMKIQGGGYIACGTTTTGSVTLNVVLQHSENGVWVSKGVVQTGTKSWSSITRGARTFSVPSSLTDCQVGDWRTEVTGGDGYLPNEWHSDTATFVAGDSGVCGSYGGGD